MLLENVIIPPCVRGFAIDAERFDVLIQNGAIAQGGFKAEVQHLKSTKVYR